MMENRDKKLNPLFVLGCNSNGYGVIRSLAESKLNLEVYGVDFNIESPGLYSKYLTDNFLITDPNIDAGKAADDICNLAMRFTIKPVAIITSDIFLFLFNAYREKLSEAFLFNIPEKNLLNTILDKRKQYQLISSLGDDLPLTIFYSQDSDTRIIDDIVYPVFIKGASPHIWKQYFAEKGFVASNKNELLIKTDELLNLNLDFIIQEIIAGPNSNHFKFCSYYDDNGEGKLFFTTQKRRQFPYDFGVGSYMISKRVEELLEKGKYYFNSLKYKGIGSIEFKIDGRDGKFKFIELNPRMWQQNYQATKTGINFAETYYLDCIGNKITYSESFRENVTYIDTVNDFQSFIYNKKITKETYFDWVQQVLTADSYAFYQMSDIKPILKSSKYGLNLIRYGKSLIQKLLIKK